MVRRGMAWQGEAGQRKEWLMNLVSGRVGLGEARLGLAGSGMVMFGSALARLGMAR